ncbi:MAG: DinB family protein [Candidatus Eisenbacteria bacterium]|nr:DinB family protein [Candidatus Eisenbacteria bacterium]
MPATTTITRPASEEVPSHYATYLAALPSGELMDHLRRQAEETGSLLARLDQARAAHRYAPGKWSVMEVLGHVVDCERIFAYRLLRFARGDSAALAGFDQDAYVVAGGFESRSVANLRAEYAGVRASTIALLESLDEESLIRSGTANEVRISVRAIAWVIGGHERHHLDVLRDRYETS